MIERKWLKIEAVINIGKRADEYKGVNSEMDKLLLNFDKNRELISRYNKILKKHF